MVKTEFFTKTLLGILVIVPMMAGCDPISLTVFGVGTGAGVAHTMSGYTYKTFAEPLPKVRKAALAALDRMAIKVNSTEKIEYGEVIKAKAADRDIEIELEALTKNTTRMRAIARKGAVIMDSATATEIILQTEKILGNAV